MSAGAGRATVAIALVLGMAVPVLAQTDADRLADTFAGEAERSANREAGSAHKAEDKRKNNETEAKAARSRKASEIRKEAEAQHAKALARRKAEESRAAAEEEMLARARQEADAAKAAGEIRRLIEEAEAARLRAEQLLDQERGPRIEQQAVPRPTQQGRDEVRQAREDTERRAREAESETARIAERAKAAAARAADHQRRLARLQRVRELRDARLAAEARRAAEAAEVRAREEEAARLSLARAEELRAQRSMLAKVTRLRQARAAAEARRAADLAEAERVGSFERTAKADRLEAETKRGGVAREGAGARGLGPHAVDGNATATEPEGSDLAQRHANDGNGHPSGELDRFVTVLMIMAPGNYGIRRGTYTADPVLCTIDGCYVSAGADNLATFLPRRKALGFGNTFGRRAGACRQSLHCAFRGVALDLPGLLQPVDLHILKHDRRRPQVVATDSQCRLLAGRLACAKGFYAEDYVLWVVPERLANMAGPAVLERALRDGLAAPRSAEAPGKRVP